MKAPPSPLGQPTPLVEAVELRAPEASIGGNGEARVGHAEWAEQPPPHHLAQRRILHPRHQQTQQIGAGAVVERRPRLGDQGKSGQSGDPVVGRHLAVDLATERVRVGTSERTSAEGGVGEAGAVRQQILERDRPLGGIGRVQRPVRITQHAHVRELGRPATDRIVQGEAPFLEQRQGDDRRDRLGDRSDPEQCVALDR